MYNKIFTKILDSSIWLEPMPTRIVWLTFIAAMDEDGMVQFASPANVARRANVSLAETVKALATLEGPDANSSDPENEGRRLEKVPGGWVVLNAKKYRDIVTRANVQEKTRERVRAFRARKSGNAHVTQANDSVTSSDAGARSVSEAKTETETGRARDPADDIDAVVQAPKEQTAEESQASRLSAIKRAVRWTSQDATRQEDNAGTVDTIASLPVATKDILAIATKLTMELKGKPYPDRLMAAVIESIPVPPPPPPLSTMDRLRADCLNDTERQAVDWLAAADHETLRAVGRYLNLHPHADPVDFLRGNVPGCVECWQHITGNAGIVDCRASQGHQRAKHDAKDRA
jgi:hypothetical protein